jgi:CheY-like chemotaxis protein
MSDAAYNTGMKILVADDEPQLRKVYERILGRAHEVRAVSDGMQGLEQIDAGFCPDIIFSDFDMGVGFMSGTSFCTRLRERGNPVPFVLVSSNDQVRELAAECGAQCGLRKPFIGPQLVGLLKRLVPGPESAALQVDYEDE